VIPDRCETRDVLLQKYNEATSRYARLVIGLSSQQDGQRVQGGESIYLLVKEALLDCVRARDKYEAYG